MREEFAGTLPDARERVETLALQLVNRAETLHNAGLTDSSVAMARFANQLLKLAFTPDNALPDYPKR